jgi:hypothetical protein
VRKFKLIVFSIFCASQSNAQNIIPNGNFEDTASSFFGSVKAENWDTPTNGSPDYLTPFHQDNFPKLSAPNNFPGYQEAKSGIAYSGLIIYSLFANNDSKRYREYLQNRFTKPLVQDSLYCLQLYVSLADSQLFASKNKLGVYFSQNQVGSNDFFYLPVQPQIMVSPDTFITEKERWVEYNFEYQAQGGEEYITIGNFTDSTEVDTLKVGGGDPNNPDFIGTYYYIDDVYLGHCDSIPLDTGVGLQESELIGRNHRLYPNPANEAVRLTFEVRVNEEFTFSLYDLQGRLVQEQLLQVGNEHRIVLQKDYFVPRNRLYLYQIRYANGEFLSGKLMVE